MLLVHPLLEAVEDIAVAIMVYRTTVLPHATNVVDLTTTPEIVKRKL